MAGSITNLLTSTVYNFITLKGLVNAQGRVLEEISRPGVDGVAYRELHSRADVTVLVGVVDADTIAAANSRYTNMLAMQGKLVDAVDDYGTTYEDAVLLKVERVSQHKLAAGSGGISAAKGALIALRFELHVTG